MDALAESQLKEEDGARAKDSDKKEEASPEAGKEEEDALKKNSQDKWVNRNGSQKWQSWVPLGRAG